MISKTLPVIAFVSMITYGACQTTPAPPAPAPLPTSCFKCVLAGKFWDNAAATPACVATSTAQTYNTLEACAADQLYSTTPVVVNLDSNFDFKANTQNTIDILVNNDGTEKVVEFNQALKTNYQYTMTDNGIQRWSYFFNTANAADANHVVHINPNSTYYTSGVGRFANYFVCPSTATAKCSARIIVAESASVFSYGVSFAALVLAFLAMAW